MAGTFDPVTEESDLAEAYRLLQIVVGLIAVTLCPIVMGVDHLFGDIDELRGSVSAYYYGRAGNWFVGALIAIAVFFLSYEYRPRPGRNIDNLQSTLGAVLAAIVGLVPTSSNPSAATGGEKIAHHVHEISAALLLITLAVFSLYHFTKTVGEVSDTTPWSTRLLRIFRTDWDALAPDALAKVTPQKRTRNVVYRICGWIIVGALIAALLTVFFDLGRLFLWAEVVAVTAFGISWLVKGGAFPFLNDPGT